MRFRVFGDDGDRDLLFVMGWGNRWTHEPVRWLIEQLTDAGYRVHAAEIPTNVDDFRAEWIEPVAEYRRDLEEFDLLGHSAGGLIASFVDGADSHVYLSPWWGYSEDVSDWLLDLVARLDTTARIIPSTIEDRATLGEYATEAQMRDGPGWLSPAFVRETRAAQAAAPPVEDDAVVFASLTDEVVSTRAIGRRVPERQVVLYDGGHELFSSRGREERLPVLLDALEEGVSAITDRGPTLPPEDHEAVEAGERALAEAAEE